MSRDPLAALLKATEPPKLTANQLEVLDSLRDLRERPKFTKSVEINGVKTNGWGAPLDFGGTNDSHHSHTAKALAKRGLVDRHKYGCRHRDCNNNFACRDKGACYYRITDAGLAALKNVEGKEHG